MLFEDGRFDEYERRVKELLYAWEDYRVLDVACGYGRFAPIFEDYTGIDFSSEMVALAEKKNPGKTFVCEDAKRVNLGHKKYDIVFEVNSLKSLDMTPEEFFEKYYDHARIAIACLEADQFIVRQIYRKI